jgi:cellulose synthase (UDP-forming)
MKLLYKKSIVHFLTIITGVYVIYYLWWRAAYTLNSSALIFSIILLIAEIQGIVNFFLFALMIWNTDKKEDKQPIQGASVDVFVPTYNEDIEILEATLIGCLNMKYEHITYVLDDGRRPEVKMLAEKLGCEYLTRSDNKHAKAGNINAALKRTKGEFIVVLDADMVPQPDFIEKTLGYFNDTKTAIVQLPQEFYNLDSIQHHEKAAYWHEQQLFYHVIQPGKDKINSAFWCGSPSILRRKALEEIGGVATESITEDFLTSIKLNSKGWKITYHNEVLAFGIAPQSLYAFNLQRLRWAQGAMKIFKSKDNPLIVPGLTLKQRLSHFSAIFTYFDSYQKLIYLLVPSIILITGVMPIKVTNTFDFFIHWIPYFALTMLFNISAGRGYFKYFEIEKYNTLKMFTFIRASLSLIFSKNMIFRVTPKTIDNSIKAKERKGVRGQIILFSIIIISIIIGTVNTIWTLYLSYSSLFTAISAIFWSVFNGYILFLALHDVLKRMYFRNDYRFPIELKSKIIDQNGVQLDTRVSDISRSGISLIEFDAEELESNPNLDIYLPDGVLNASGNIVYNRAAGDGKRKLGIKFNELSFEAKIKLYIFLFVTTPRNRYDSINKKYYNSLL